MSWINRSDQHPRNTVYLPMSVYKGDTQTLVDDSAVAFEFARIGLKIESKTLLQAGQEYYFVISNPHGTPLSLYGRVSWSERGAISHLSGIEVTRCSVLNRWRLYLLRCDFAVDWRRLFSVIVTSSALLIITAAAGKLFSSHRAELRFMIHFIPTIIAVVLAVWAAIRLVEEA